MNISSFKLHYQGSLIWLIFWMFVFFPIAFVLLFTSSSFELDHSIYYLRYNGSRFWLCFWVLVFFPIAFIFIFLNGLSLFQERIF
ncbi:Uncharacterized protein PRO82_000039 [Candidatus Protochlamydia amoebophila]|nr:Uncharacterized protein [Candidatus Protochlamydia amoebophila]